MEDLRRAHPRAVLRPISADEVIAAQDAWAEAILEIGRSYAAGGDYRRLAARRLRRLYHFSAGVLFKPDASPETPFRGAFEEVLSFYVGGVIAGDDGFALRGWSAIRFGERLISTDGPTALAMGAHHFTGADGETLARAEYSLGYARDADDRVRITLHHTALPEAQTPAALNVSRETPHE